MEKENTILGQILIVTMVLFMFTIFLVFQIYSEVVDLNKYLGGLLPGVSGIAGTISNSNSRGGGAQALLGELVTSPPQNQINLVPTITSLSQYSAGVIERGGTGIRLIVYGLNFGNNSRVKWKTNNLQTTFIPALPGVLEVVVPAAYLTIAERDIPIQVVNVANPTTQNTTSNIVQFTVGSGTPNAPRITSLNESSKLRGSDSFTLTITGTGFTSSSVITYNAIPLTTTIPRGSTTIASAIISRTRLAGAGVNSMRVRNGQAGVITGAPSSNGVPFVVANPVPSISDTDGLTPNERPRDNSITDIVVTGNNFVTIPYASVVNFNGTQKPVTRYDSSTQLMIRVPGSWLPRVGDYNISIFNPAPGGGFSSFKALKVVAAP